MAKKAFTLIEILIVLLIVGTLASLALPKFFDIKEKSIRAEAYEMIGTIAHTESLYYLEKNEYVYLNIISWPPQDDQGFWDKLGLNSPNMSLSSHFSYTVVSMTSNGNVIGLSIRAYRRKPGTFGTWPYSMEYRTNEDKFYYMYP